MTFTQHVTYRVTTEGIIERGTGQLPSMVKLPALSVTVAPEATEEGTARLLMHLAAQLQGIRHPDKAEMDGWLALRKDAALKIDPVTAEVYWKYGYTIDPYSIYRDLLEEEKQIGRVYFARAPESDIWVSFGDLTQNVRDAFWKKLASMPDGWHCDGSDRSYDLPWGDDEL